MKLPSGREISIDSLASAAEMMARESFYQENADEGDEEVAENLKDRYFSLGGTEPPFSEEDAMAIINVLRPVAEEIGGELAAVMDRYTPLTGPSPIKELIEKEVRSAKTQV